MQFRTKIIILGFTVIASVVIAALLKPISQDLAYHHFADSNTMVGVFNFLNVISNLPFLIVGVIGLSALKKAGVKGTIAVIYLVLFTGILLIGFGSAYYHYMPDNNRLVFDRIPMSIVFMAFLSAVVSECINIKAGRILLFPLVILGISSVLWWHNTELQGRGDLRFYLVIQFYPVLIIPVILIMFPSPVNAKSWRSLMFVVIWYVVAKVFEHFDVEIYTATGFISGHTLKHIAAAAATWYMVDMFVKKYVLRSGS